MASERRTQRGPPTDGPRRARRADAEAPGDCASTVRGGAARERADELVRRARIGSTRSAAPHRGSRRSGSRCVRMHRRGGPLLSGGLAYRIFLWELPMALVIVVDPRRCSWISARSRADQMAHDVGMGAALAAAVGPGRVADRRRAPGGCCCSACGSCCGPRRSAVERPAADQPDRLGAAGTAEDERRGRPPLVFVAMMLLAIVGNYLGGRLAAGGAVANRRWAGS